jgi:hypothetical protein
MFMRSKSIIKQSIVGDGGSVLWIAVATIALLSVSGCAFFNLTPDQQQAKLAADEAKVVYLMKAAGCVTQAAAGTAQDLGVSAVIDAQGNAVLTKAQNAAGKACSLTVPAAAVAAPSVPAAAAKVSG